MLTVDKTRPVGPAGRISRVETLTLGTAWRDFSYVRVHTDAGLSGVGEITHPYRSRETCQLAEAMADRHLIGADPFDVEEIWLRMYQGDYLRGGDVGGVVVSGVDQALYDLMGKALGVPAYRLTGGACRDRVRVYANGWYTGDREPAAFAERARDTVARGWTALKFDPFGAGLGELSRTELRRSVDIVAAVRDAVGPEVDLFVEGHARFAMHTAMRLVRELEPFDLGWFEEPLPWTHIERYAELRARATMPISGGEHFHNRYEYARLFATEAVDIIQPDLSMAGGFTEVRKLAAIADQHAMVVAPHNSNSPLCTTASVHAVLGMPNFKILETFDGLLEDYVFEAVRGALPVVDGHIALPTAPGLGIELVDEVFTEHPPSHGFWNMFAEGWEKRDRR
ncbi:mandelate racemase/muconate lactonizing enzyme family protein [Micromonospora echinofusca]|uniref:Mandelate racemase/muconate lactonizing enzyme family protein n=1 Tax=Micromonospora echinofusca TaxID=47858 RepID=A0ABS3VJB0_MICEH|nr:mandelate racemase/muconate lactonizing enzyme family protein [Micromonospora echinofusca]MBO4204617.1 mandelate racemase/muconate lactonizing enzyme family protein [Micromonospora echinofusca]